MPFFGDSDVNLTFDNLQEGLFRCDACFYFLMRPDDTGHMANRCDHPTCKGRVVNRGEGAEIPEWCPLGKTTEGERTRHYTKRGYFDYHDRDRR